MADLPWLAVAPTSLAYSGSIGTTGPLPMVASCHTVTNRAKMAIETSAARKVSERVMAHTAVARAICGTHLTAGARSMVRRFAPQRSLPPCGGGTGRGVTTDAVFAATPIPPPQVGREESAARTSLLGEERICGNGRDNNERPARVSSFEPYVVRLILKLLM